jgi:hypothetical protein
MQYRLNKNKGANIFINLSYFLLVEYNNTFAVNYQFFEYNPFLLLKLVSNI